MDKTPEAPTENPNNSLVDCTVVSKLFGVTTQRIHQLAAEGVISKEISIVLAPDQLLPISGGYTLGVSQSSIVIHAKKEDLPARKEAGETLNIDGREYIIDAWDAHMGMAQIFLSQTRTG
jgi:hypothetical protein